MPRKFEVARPFEALKMFPRSKVARALKEGGPEAALEALSKSFATYDELGQILIDTIETPGCEAVIKRLLFRGASPNAVDPRDVRERKALHRACAIGSESYARILIEEGAGVNVVAEGSLERPIHVALSVDSINESIVALLLEKGADAISDNRLLDEPIVVACKRGFASIVGSIASNASDEDLRNIGAKLLSIAVERGHADIVDILLRRIAIKISPDVLCTACFKGYSRIAEMLLSRGADPDEANKRGSTPLISACMSPTPLEIVPMILAVARNPKKTDPNGSDALHVAASRGNAALALLLLDAGFESRPIEEACSARSDEIVEMLLDRGGIPKPRDARIAFESRAHRSLELLLEMLDSFEESMLCDSVARDYDESFDVLLNAGCNVETKNSRGETALHIASARGRIEFAKRLIARGARVNATNNVGSTPLHAAVQQGHFDVVKLLLESGAYPNTTNAHGCSPLHYACIVGDARIVKELRANGARKDEPDAIGSTAFDHAKKRGRLDIAKMLE